ncbi:MAG: hypothetical protein ACR2Q4_07335 [Geminicoccaceae bacterium]
MKLEPMVAAVAVLSCMVTPIAAQAAGDSGPYKASTAVKFEDIPDSEVKRVILTEKAEERLGIELGQIDEDVIVRKQIVGGRVIIPVGEAPEKQLSGGSFNVELAAAGDDNEGVDDVAMPVLEDAWVLVTLSPQEWERTKQDLPARLLPLQTRGDLPGDLMAEPSGLEPSEDPKRTMLTAYYIIPGKDHGLTLNERVRVELELQGDDTKQMVAPIAGIYYDGVGDPWVYTNPEPLTYERKRVTVDKIVGTQAVLTDGPPVGTEIVTVGNSLLFGAEVIFKR